MTVPLAQTELKKQEQKEWASGRYLLDAQIAALQEKIQSLDADIEVLLMEQIQDKANAIRYDSLIATEQAAARRGWLTSNPAELISAMK